MASIAIWQTARVTFAVLRFYTHWQAGMSKAAALRQAQLDVASEYPDPYFWAGFVLSGDGGEMGEEEMSLLAPTTLPVAGTPTTTSGPRDNASLPSWAWLLVAALAVTGVGGVVLWRRIQRR